LQAAVKQALSIHHITPPLDFDQNINFNPFNLSVKSQEPTYITTSDRHYAQFKNLQEPKIEAQDWQKLFDRLHEPIQPLAVEPGKEGVAKESAQTAILHLSSANTLPVAGTSLPKSLELQEIKIAKMQLHGQYILAPVKSGLLVIDQNAAHERILYEKYLQDLTNQTGASQQLLFPCPIHVHPADLALVQDQESALKALGFIIESFGKDSLLISGLPSEAANQDPKQLIEGFLEQIKWHQTQTSLPVKENLIRSLAKRVCIPVGKKLTIIDMDALVDQLFACKNPNQTPEGRKIWTILSMPTIEQLLAK
jgi:DNA mismatch repair protein MutL